MSLTFDPEEIRRSALDDEAEIARLAASADPGNAASLLNFGAEAARGIARTSDTLLKDMDAGPDSDPGPLLEALAGVMGRIDLDEPEPRPGLLGRLLGRGAGGDQGDALLAKYDALGGELDRVFVGLKAYAALLNRDNRRLEALYRENVRYYRELERYVAAGERVKRDLAARLAEREAAATVGDGASAFEAQTLKSALAAMERRVHDLRTAEVTALQCLPMLKTLQMNNRELAQKIDAAFIVTLPAFRAAMGDAVRQKRRRLRGEAMSALEARRGEEALEKSRREIVEGIEAVRALRRRAGEEERQARRRLEGIGNRQ